MLTKAERLREALWMRRCKYEIDHKDRPKMILRYLERLAKVWGLEWRTQ